MRRIETEGEARAELKAAKSAGVPLKAWARLHGIDGRSLNAWRINLERPERATPRLVELVPAPDIVSASRYTVRVADATIELGDDFREETLARILRALRAC